MRRISHAKLLDLIARLEKIARDGSSAKSLMPPEQYYPLLQVIEDMKKIERGER